MKLRAENLVKTYKKRSVVKGISVEVNQGEIVGLLGPNGAGKSTILKSIYGIAKVTAGSVTINKDGNIRNVLTSKPHNLSKIGIGYVPQIENIFPALSIEENLEVGYVDYANRKMEDLKSEMFQRYPDLANRAKSRAGTLSGGQRQMLAMARALMSAPDVLLLDEPSAGLAPALVDELFDELVKINQSGVTILMVEQNARRALDISDYGYVLDMGRNRHEGDGRKLADDPEIVGIYLGRK